MSNLDLVWVCVCEGEGRLSYVIDQYKTLLGRADKT